MTTSKSTNKRAAMQQNSKEIALPHYGCFVQLDSSGGVKTIMTAPMLLDGTCDDDWIEVSAPNDQGFLDAVNAEFNTSFQMKDFPGR
jgi:long-subunit fatty acid transport protein